MRTACSNRLWRTSSNLLLLHLLRCKIRFGSHAARGEALDFMRAPVHSVDVCGGGTEVSTPRCAPADTRTQISSCVRAACVELAKPGSRAGARRGAGLPPGRLRVVVDGCAGECRRGAVARAGWGSPGGSSCGVLRWVPCRRSLRHGPLSHGPLGQRGLPGRRATLEAHGAQRCSIINPQTDSSRSVAALTKFVTPMDSGLCVDSHVSLLSRAPTVPSA